MGKNVQIRNLDPKLWKEFQKRCERRYGKVWGHIPNPDSPKTSASRYVLEALIRDHLDGTHTAHQDDIAKDVLSQLREIEEHEGAITRRQVKTTIEKTCRKRGLRDTRTIKSYQTMLIGGEFIIDADCAGETDRYTTHFKVRPSQICPDIDLYR